MRRLNPELGTGELTPQRQALPRPGLCRCSPERMPPNISVVQITLPLMEGVRLPINSTAASEGRVVIVTS
jgi:hypothetical protein